MISPREKRHSRIRKYLVGTSERPRVAVYRSAKHIYAQIIDDTQHKTLIAESDLKLDKLPKKEKAFKVGVNLAQKAKSKKIEQVVFDRGGFLYHGRIEEVAKGLREGGLKF